MFLRRLLKFLHTMGAIGLMGSMASLVVLIGLAPPAKSLAGYALTLGAMAEITRWIFFPSLVVTLISGLLAIVANPAFNDSGWVWVKAATGILMFEGGFTRVMGPIQEQAQRSVAALAGRLDPAAITTSLGAERNTLWLLLAVSTANVVLGVWRPRFFR